MYRTVSVYIGPGMCVLTASPVSQLGTISSYSYSHYSRLPTLPSPPFAPSHARTCSLSIFLLAQNSHRVKNFKPTSTLCFGWRRPQSPPEIRFILKQQSSELYLRKKDSGMRKKLGGSWNDGVILGYMGYKVNVRRSAGFGKCETMPRVSLSNTADCVATVASLPHWQWSLGPAF